MFVALLLYYTVTKQALEKERDALFKKLEEIVLCKVCYVSHIDISQSILMPCLHRDICHEVFSPQPMS